MQQVIYMMTGLNYKEMILIFQNIPKLFKFRYFQAKDKTGNKARHIQCPYIVMWKYAISIITCNTNSLFIPSTETTILFLWILKQSIWSTYLSLKYIQKCSQDTVGLCYFVLKKNTNSKTLSMLVYWNDLL